MWRCRCRCCCCWWCLASPGSPIGLYCWHCVAPFGANDVSCWQVFLKKYIKISKTTIARMPRQHGLESRRRRAGAFLERRRCSRGSNCLATRGATSKRCPRARQFKHTTRSTRVVESQECMSFVRSTAYASRTHAVSFSIRSFSKSVAVRLASSVMFFSNSSCSLTALRSRIITGSDPFTHVYLKKEGVVVAVCRDGRSEQYCERCVRTT